MKKLTAEKCRSAIESIKMRQTSIREEIYLQALEIALPVLEQQESATDNYRQIYNDGWIEWGGGEMPVSENPTVDVRLRNGEVRLSEPANSFIWSHGYYHYVPETAVDIIAYRVIENDGREG